MRKLLLTAAALGGLLGLATTGASAAPVAVERHAAPAAHAQVTPVDYYYHHRHYHHRHWEHGHWRYW
ncbi:MAG: hypothetical protein ACJ8AI_17735 [Rhodopila sp.]